MPNSDFLAYVGVPDIHDGHIQEVSRNEDIVTVRIESNIGSLITLEFIGVSEVKAVEPVGMVLYALVEMSVSAPHRRFVFINWEEPEDDSARLEIIAAGFRMV